MKNSIFKKIIVVNYDKPEAIKKAISMIGKGFPLYWDDMPLVGTGKVKKSVREECLGRTWSFENNLSGLLMQRGRELGVLDGFKLADPLTFLLYVCTFPDTQRKHPLITLYVNKEGRKCFLRFDNNGLECDYRDPHIILWPDTHYLVNS